MVALGVGIGVDYGIYIFARMREAMQQGRTLSESYFVALKTTGIAIFYTALTLAVGVAMWIFSDLKFQADMGIMLTFMFVVNMIAAIIFLPALCRWLLRPGEKDNFDVAHWHGAARPGTRRRRRPESGVSCSYSSGGGAVRDLARLRRAIAQHARRAPSRRRATAAVPTWSPRKAMPSSDRQQRRHQQVGRDLRHRVALHEQK